MATPTIDRFLQEVARIVNERQGKQLQEMLVVEPPLPPQYESLVAELRRCFAASSSRSDAMVNKCKSFIAEYEDGEDGGSRLSFISFLVKYFEFIRDVNVGNLVETHDLLKALLNHCILALSSYIGLVVLPTVISLSKMLAKLAIGLDKRPDLIAHLTQRLNGAGGGEIIERVTLVESSANAIREGFKKCLSERSGGPNGLDAQGRPEGRRVGIYVTANLCLKLFFHCKKLRSAEQIFGNIYQQSPPLSLFPAAQRVTYLYYLGRYLFANGHFFRAQIALQEAYNQCHGQCSAQKRLILVYLIAANLILGRFPSQLLWAAPHAVGLYERYAPICRAIAQGDLAGFRTFANMQAPHAEWFLSKRIFLQLVNRCEILIWRSLARRSFLLCGNQGDAANKKAPTLALQDVLTLAVYLERKVQEYTLSKYGNIYSGTDVSRASIDPDFADVVTAVPSILPDMRVLESIFTSLIDQGLLHGFLSHSQLRFAITGAKAKAPLQVGFPRIWNVLEAKSNSEVPGWKKRENPTVGGATTSGPGYAANRGFGPGMVVNLTGAKPVGVV